MLKYMQRKKKQTEGRDVRGTSVNIFNIEDFSVDDGPGLRMVVFFKGCSLACRWCHNPESIGEKCIGCGACFSVCPAGAHRTKDGRHTVDEKKCTGCMRCVSECFSGALMQSGERVDTDRVFERILGNRPYFDESGGGVTFSGGECMLQADGLAELLKRCRENGIHTAVDTAGNIPWASFEKVLPYADLFLYDLKAMDPAVHAKCTGADNARILSNFERLQERGARVLVRIPYIPGWNDGELPAIAAYLRRFPEVKAELLGYHMLGSSKYRALGMEPIEARAPSREELDALREKYGLL